MHQMNNLEYAFLVHELAEKLVGKHFSRIRKLAEGLYRMKIGSTEVICQPGVRLHSTKYIEEAAEPDKFVQKLEKELDNAKLLSIEQINKDRIIAFGFSLGTLIFEMFGKGNIILVRDGKTICALRYESWSDREIKAGMPYKYPSTMPSERLELSDKYIISSLMRLPLGKDYALEALARAGIDEKRPGTGLASDELASLEAQLGQMRQSSTPTVFYKEGKPAAFSLAALSSCSGLETRTFKSLSEAADEYYANLEEIPPELEKLEKRLEKQQERLQLLVEEEKQNRQKGDFIYGRFSEIEKILEFARANRFDDIRPAPNVDKRKKTIELDVQ